MSKIDIIDTCKDWISILNPLEDIEYQKKYWFDDEGPMISSFEEATEHFTYVYEVRIKYPEFQKLCNQECQGLLKELYLSLKKYRMDERRILEYEPDIALLGDPKWLEIVKLAQNTVQELKNNIDEVENAKK